MAMKTVRHESAADVRPGIAQRDIERHDVQSVDRGCDSVVVEEPMEIRARGQSIAVTMRTPGHDEELAAGFLVGEGVIRSSRDIIRIEHCLRREHDHVVNVVLAPEVPLDLDRLSRHVFASSSCGVCGKATIDAVRQTFPRISSACGIDTNVLMRLPERLKQLQQTFGETGGLHAAGLFTCSGECVVVREDVGRHNAVDKVLGHAVRELTLPLSNCVLLVTGRASFEIVQKALAGGIAIVAAVSAPSSLAVDLARESGQTLIGFLREERFNVYAHADRIRSHAGRRADR